MALLGRLKRPARPENGPAVPEGLRIYAIGDVHGRDDLLAELHAAIVADAEEFVGSKQVVYLGDFIDRGMESREVVERLMDAPVPGFEPVHLMGNHEYALLNFIYDPESIPGWLSWGGRETLYSYGIKCGMNPSPRELQNLAGELQMAMPREHVRFMESAALFHRVGDYYFVHAGVRPGVALEKQKIEDQLFIREPFISSTRNHGAVVVHGHTVAEQVQLIGNRIGLDTGAYYTGVLSCVVLESTGQRLIQTGVAA